MNKFLLSVGFLLMLYGLSNTVWAQTLQSPSYQIEESFIGPGGDIEGASPGYQGGGSSVGDTGIGQSTSPSYRTQAGYNTTNDPRLSMVVNTPTVGFGGLSTATASTANSSFSVLNYTAYGYGVYTIGATPSNGSHNLTGMNPAAASQVGTEQYGINLKANTSPTTFGADPAQVPSSEFAYGVASSGYNTANNYRYVSGEKIAEAPQTSGQTDFTISYIINISDTTPGGQYTGSQGLVVVGTY